MQGARLQEKISKSFGERANAKARRRNGAKSFSRKTTVEQNGGYV